MKTGAYLTGLFIFIVLLLFIQLITVIIFGTYKLHYLSTNNTKTKSTFRSYFLPLLTYSKVIRFQYFGPILRAIASFQI